MFFGSEGKKGDVVHDGMRQQTAGSAGCSITFLAPSSPSMPSSTGTAYSRTSYLSKCQLNEI